MCIFIVIIFLIQTSLYSGHQSDLTILTRGGVLVRAHSLVLAAASSMMRDALHTCQLADQVGQQTLETTTTKLREDFTIT